MHAAAAGLVGDGSGMQCIRVEQSERDEVSRRRPGSTGATSAAVLSAAIEGDE